MSEMTLLEYLRSNAVPVPWIGCRIWEGGMQRGSMPTYRLGRKNYSARRMLAETILGRPLASGERASMRCGMSGCMAEEHLVVETSAQFQRRLVREGALSTGRRRSQMSLDGWKGKARLGSEHAQAVADMRSSGAGLAAIGAKYGVTEAGVHAAIKRWVRIGLIEKPPTPKRKPRRKFNPFALHAASDVRAFVKRTASLPSVAHTLEDDEADCLEAA